jgi:hypothetical protein
MARKRTHASVLGIDAAWTPGNASGVALITKKAGNVRQFSDGSRVMCLLHEDPDSEETETLHLDNAFDAQEFVVWWYAPASARDGRCRRRVWAIR